MVDSEAAAASGGGVIRPAAAADLPAIAAIVEAAYGPYVARIGRKPGPMLDDYAALIAAGHVHVLDDDGVRGLLVLMLEGRSMLLDNVALHPSAQGRGFGSRLLAFAEDQARDAGCTTLRLYTNERMVENIALYGRRGFVETHRAEEKGLRRVFMAKVLRGAPVAASLAALDAPEDEAK